MDLSDQKRLMPSLSRAYTVLDVKEIKESDDAFHIKGIASTPTPDRVQDVVEPLGARFKTPMPLLLYHDATQPVGQVTFAKPSKSGIPFEATLPYIKEAGRLKDRVDEAIQSIKYRLIAGVSIGFKPLKDGAEFMENGGIHFTEWSWLELSLVTVPANQEATITTFKSLDLEHLRAASGDSAGRLVVHLKSHPVGSGKTAAQIPKETDMSTKTLAEQIVDFENKRAANLARANAIQTKAIEEGRSKEDGEKKEFDDLMLQNQVIDAELTDLRAMEKQMAASASAVTKEDGASPAAGTKIRENSGIISLKQNIEKGIPFARYALALGRAHGNRAEALAQVQANKHWMDQTPEVAHVLKTAIPAADTLTSGWASELVYAQNMASEFIEYLRPMTILGQLTEVRRVPFNIRMGSLTGGTTGYWVGQGKAIPMSKGTTGSTSLGITKAAGMAAYDDELLKSSSPSIETMLRDDLARAVAQVIDVAFIDPNNGGIANEKPASILYGVTPTSASGTNAAAVSTDVAAVFVAAIAANLDPMSGVWVMTPTTALRLSMMQTTLGSQQYPGITIKGGTWQGLPVVVSPNAFISGSPDYGNMIVLILQREIIVADDGDVDVQISNEASIEMLDNPTNLSTGATQPTTVVSMFQTQSWAIKAVRYVNWTKRRSAAAAFIRGAAYA